MKQITCFEKYEMTSLSQLEETMLADRVKMAAALEAEARGKQTKKLPIPGGQGIDGTHLGNVRILWQSLFVPKDGWRMFQRADLLVDESAFKSEPIWG